MLHLTWFIHTLSCLNVVGNKAFTSMHRLLLGLLATIILATVTGYYYRLLANITD